MSKKKPKAKEGRSPLEKVLIALVVVLLSQLIAAVLLLVAELKRADKPLIGDELKESEDELAASGGIGSYKAGGRHRQRSSEVCLSLQCIEEAADILHSIDNTISPCNDFYQYACGNWMRKTPLPDSTFRLNRLFTLQDEIDRKIRKLLMADKKPEDIPVEGKAKDLYASCMDVDAIDKIGSQPLVDLLSTEFGGWPLIDPEWSETNFDLVDLMIKINKYSQTPIINLGVSEDSSDPSRMTLSLAPPDAGMRSLHFYLRKKDEQAIQGYTKFIHDIGIAMGLKKSAGQESVKEIVDLEMELANLHIQKGEAKKGWEYMELSDLEAWNNQIFNWNKYVTKLLAIPEIGITDVTGKEKILNHDPYYYSQLGELLNATSKRTIADYMIWHFIESIVLTQGRQFVKAEKNFYQTMFGLYKTPPRYKTCSQYIVGDLGLVVGRMFIKDHFDQETKQSVENMAGQIRDSFVKVLKDVDWMDKETKEAAMDKAKTVNIHIGYPPGATNETYLKDHFKDHNYEGKTFFEKTLVNLKMRFYITMKSLRKPVKERIFKETITSTKPHYLQNENALLFPAGILQPPFFSKAYSKSLNFGAAGSLIGHKFTRVFGKIDGNVPGNSTKPGVTKFNEKLQCLVDQYNKFVLPSVNIAIDGEQSLPENVADNLGVELSFKVYKQWVAEQGKEEPMLPGLSHTHNQLFFLSFARAHCRKANKVGDKIQLTIDDDTPNNFRVIGVAQNSKEFAEAFNCPFNSKMNPNKKCEIW